jgi:hypothetical protein
MNQLVVLLVQQLLLEGKIGLTSMFHIVNQELMMGTELIAQGSFPCAGNYLSQD